MTNQLFDTLGTLEDSRVAIELKPFIDTIEVEKLLEISTTPNFNSFHFLLLNDEVQNIFIGQDISVYLLRN